MMLKAFNMNKAPAAIGIYSQAMTAGERVFISGHLGLDPDTGEMVGEDMKSLAGQDLENLKNILTVTQRGVC